VKVIIDRNLTCCLQYGGVSSG